MIRIVLAAPALIAGRALTSIGYAIADARHLDPHARPKKEVRHA